MVSLLLADRVGFEPTSHLRDYLISSQGRYDHFDTCPYSIYKLLLNSPVYYSRDAEIRQDMEANLQKYERSVKKSGYACRRYEKVID